MNPFKAVGWCAVCLAVLLIDHQPIFAQETISAPVPPAPVVRVKYCVKVRCNGSNSFKVVSGTGIDEPTARSLAIENATAHCGEAGVAEIREDVPDLTCQLEEPDEPDAFRAAESKSVTAGKPWRVRASLHYCDGSPGDNVTSGAATNCEARCKAYRGVCAMKDPCRRAYVTFDVCKSPCCPSPCRCPD